MTTGRLIGVGVGPGDPGLLTLNAIAALNAADVIAHFTKAGNASNARTIAAKHLKPGVEELSLLYPLTTEIPKEDAAYRETLREFYDSAAAQIAGHLDQDRTVAVIAEGDPLFYGSYMHLHVRLSPRYPTEIIAGLNENDPVVIGMSRGSTAQAQNAVVNPFQPQVPGGFRPR